MLERVEQQNADRLQSRKRYSMLRHAERARYDAQHSEGIKAVEEARGRAKPQDDNQRAGIAGPLIWVLRCGSYVYLCVCVCV